MVGSAPRRSCHRLGGTSNCNQGPEGNSVATGSRSASSSRVAGPTGSTTSPSSPAAGPEKPRMSTSRGRSTPESSSCRSWRRPWTGSWGAYRHRDRSPRWARGPQPRACEDPLRDPTPLFDEIRELPTKKATAHMQQMYRQSGPARTGHPADQGAEGRRHHHGRVGHPAEDRAVRPGPAGRLSWTSW